MNLQLVRHALFGLCVLGSSSVMATNGMLPYGLGTKAKGLGGAGIAMPEEAMSIATNPAAGVWVGQSYELGASLFSPRREITEFNTGSGVGGGFVNQGTYTSDSDYFLIPHAAWNWRLKENSSFALAVYGAGGMNTDYPTAMWNGNTGGGTGIDLKQLFIAPTYSHKLNDKTSVGISAIIAMQAFEAKGLRPFNNHTVDSTKLTDNGTDFSYGLGVRVGAQREIVPGLTAAFSYSPKINMSKFDDYAGLFADGGDLDIPATAVVGLAWKLSDRSAIVFDVQRIWYSDVKAIGTTLNTGCPSFTGGAANSLCFGGSNGPGFGWNDMTVYKLGYQLRASKDWTWRVGYSHGKNPVDETTLNILAPAVIEDHFTFGFTKATGKNSELNFAFMYAPENSVRRTSAVGAPDDIELKMYQYEMELSWSKRF